MYKEKRPKEVASNVSVWVITKWDLRHIAALQPQVNTYSEAQALKHYSPPSKKVCGLSRSAGIIDRTTGDSSK